MLRRVRSSVALLVLAIVAVGCSTSEPSSTASTLPALPITASVDQTSSPPVATPGTIAPTTATAPPSSAAAPSTEPSTSGDQGGLDNDDGYLADGTTLTLGNTGYPAIANLDPPLLAALQAAANDAAVEGLEFRVNSAWRSPEYQQFLFDQAVAEHGSEQEARRWVSTPEESAHVTGDAVDLAPREVQQWLGQHGNRYGLCQAYANEAWHFELLVEPGEACPVPIADASAG